jgi:hypothetical protein
MLGVAVTMPVRFGAALAATLLLLVPALWNGFPLLQYDTGGYLARWFEGYLVPSRSVVYGLFLTAGWPFDFWPIVILQSAAAVWIIALVLRTHRLGGRAAGFLVLLTLLAVTTTLPWLSGVLLTDIFAGLSVLALHLLAMRSDQLQRWERNALVVFIAFSAATHSATFGVLLALALAAFLLSFFNPRLAPRAAAVRAVAAVALGAVMLLAANYAVAKRLAWTPGGYGIVFGRMLEDGIVTRYLDDHCPDRRFKLCPYRHVMPQNADSFLWGESVFDELGRFDGLGEEMRTIVLESLRAYPWLQLKTALIAAARQLFFVQSGEGVVDSIWHTYGIMERYTPSVVPAMRAAQQQRGKVDFRLINGIHVPMALAGMTLLPVMMMLAWRRREFADLGLLAGTVALAILANAFICGPLSNPHDRYGSRLVWIAPLVVALVPWRLRVQQSAGRLATVQT